MVRNTTVAHIPDVAASQGGVQRGRYHARNVNRYVNGGITFYRVI